MCMYYDDSPGSAVWLVVPTLRPSSQPDDGGEGSVVVAEDVLCDVNDDDDHYG